MTWKRMSTKIKRSRPGLNRTQRDMPKTTIPRTNRDDGDESVQFDRSASGKMLAWIHSDKIPEAKKRGRRSRSKRGPPIQSRREASANSSAGRLAEVVFPEDGHATKCPAPFSVKLRHTSSSPRNVLDGRVIPIHLVITTPTHDDSIQHGTAGPLYRYRPGYDNRRVTTCSPRRHNCRLSSDRSPLSRLNRCKHLERQREPIGRFFVS